MYTIVPVQLFYLIYYCIAHGNRMTQLSFDQTLASMFHWTMNKTMNIKTISCNLYLIYIQKNNLVLESRRVSLTFNQFSISRKKKKRKFYTIPRFPRIRIQNSKFQKL